MNIKALVAALVLGSSSMALAAPIGVPKLAPGIVHAVFTSNVDSIPFEFRTLPPLDVSWIRHVIEQPAPMVLANDTHLTGPTLIRVSTVRPFTKLELRASDGATTIDRVVLDYGDGRTRSVSFKSTVEGQKSLTIDVAHDASEIVKFVVVGTSKRGASIDVFAS